MPVDISIITPCLDAADYIEDSIISVLEQRGLSLEHIVVDGGSTDGTLEVLACYPHLRVVRGRDRGLYDALNRGIAMASGAVIGHLNADDRYPPRSLARALETVRMHKGVELVSGDAVVQRCDGDLQSGELRLRVGKLDVQSVTFGVPAINARFVSRALYERIGLYDIRYRRAADREFLLRAALAGVVNVQTPEVLYWYRSHSGSLTIGGNRRSYLTVGREHMEIARHYLANKRLTARDRAVLRRWHTEGATLELADSLLCGEPLRAARTIGHAQRVDPIALPRMTWFASAKLARLARDRRA